MKRRRKSLDIFNLSFLDVISCGFGAVVLLILISKTDVDFSTAGQDEVSSLLSSLIKLEDSVTATQQQIKNELAALQQLDSQEAALNNATAQLEAQLKALAAENRDLSENITGLSLVESRLRQAALPTPQKDNTERSEEVGGIPVDSDYVVFILDTSGSMKQIWPRVSREIINVLNIHPEVKGFQILNDMGTSLVSGYDGRWMPDTPVTRKNAVQLLDNWGALSNSSPVEGLNAALTKYAKANITTSIYVFGDDYTGGSYDAVINNITRQNKTLSSGRRLAKIHGIGFISPGTRDRFSILMRELTQQNDGTFIALPP